MKMKVKRKSYQIARGAPRQITACLTVLGVDFRIGIHTKRRYGFWRLYEARLHFILYDAWRAWRGQIQDVHPDKPGGNAKACAHLNAVWARIELLFARKGYVL